MATERRFHVQSLVYCLSCGSESINVKRDLFDKSIVLECRSCLTEEKLGVGFKSDKFKIKGDVLRGKGINN